MKQDKQKSILQKKVRQLEETAAGIVGGLNREDIHDFRTGFKKLRAFLRMLSLEKSRHLRRRLKQIKQIYTTAGIIRSRQICHRSIVSHFTKKDLSATAYLVTFSERTQQQGRKIAMLINRFPFGKLEKELSASVSRPLKEADIEGFLKKKEKSLQHSIQKKLSDTGIHECRKYIKDILYTLKYLPKNKKKESRLKKLAETTGRYIDSCNMLQFLKNGVAGDLSTREKKILLPLKMKHQQRKKLEKERVVKRLLVLG